MANENPDDKHPDKNDKVPVGKIERASKFLRTGLKVGRNYAKYYSKKALFQKTDKDDLDRANAEDMLSGFQELRGTALKVAQMLSLDTINLSTAFTDVMGRAQYSVPPMSGPMAEQVFSKSIGKRPEQVFDRWNSKAIKAASMGQVHEAWIGDQKFAVKVQYPGVGDSIQSDLKLVKSFASSFVKASRKEMEPYFQEVEERLMEEADYELELQNSLSFKEAIEANVEGAVMPNYYPEYSGKRVLTMSWLDGIHLTNYLAQNPSQEDKNQFGQIIWDLYDFQVHELQRVNADPHPGNFLFLPDGRLGLLDFGCTKTFTKEIYTNYFRLADPQIFESEEATERALRKLGILREDDTPEKVDFIMPLFGRLIQLLSTPMNSQEFYFGNMDFYEEVGEIGKKLSKLREVRGSKDFIYVNRTFFGLFAIMQKLDATVRTTSPYMEGVRAMWAEQD